MPNTWYSMALLQQWVRQRPWLAAGLAGVVGGVTGVAGSLVGIFGSTGIISSGSDEAIDNHPLRCAVIEKLIDHPGLCYRELQRSLGAANGSLRHHLDVLQARQSITVVRVNGRTCYFAGSVNEVEVLGGPLSDPERAAARLEVGLSAAQRAVIDHIREYGIPRSQAALARELGRSKATVHSAIKVLRRRGIMKPNIIDIAEHLQ